MPRRPSPKACRKHYLGSCFFCGEPDLGLLHAHRILPGAEGGKYHWANILPCCPTCHSKVHSGRITVHGRYATSLGAWVIHYTQDGEEQWEREDRWRA